MVVGHSTCKRSAAEYIAELRAFIEEHGRPPRNSSCLVGADEYRLRNKVQYQMKKGLFSEAETRELDRLLKGGASAGALQTGDSASQQAWSAAAATALQTGAVSEVAAPMTPRDRLPSSLLSALGATASARARRYRGKRPPPPPAAGETAQGSAAKHRLRGKTAPSLQLPDELYYEKQEGAWCGMHAFNNYHLRRCITQDHCRSAAQQVVRGLRGADHISNHLDLKTGWLSIDVLNMLGDTHLADNGLGLQVALTAGDTWRQREDAMVNWNNTHWTVLQADPFGSRVDAYQQHRGPGPGARTEAQAR